eukprot:jgi/Bigna1/127094/aug1.3_g1802
MSDTNSNRTPRSEGKSSCRKSEPVADTSSFKSSQARRGSDTTDGQDEEITFGSEAGLEKKEKKERNITKRFAVAKQMLDEETEYVRLLRSTVRSIVRSTLHQTRTGELRDFPAHMILFLDGLEQIYVINLQFLQDLQMRVNTWYQQQPLGELFLQLGPLVLLYQDYLFLYPAFLDLRTDNTWRSWFKHIEEKLDGQLEVSFLRPFNRLMQYLALAKELENVTPKLHHDHAHLREAINLLEPVVSTMRCALRDHLEKDSGSDDTNTCDTKSSIQTRIVFREPASSESKRNTNGSKPPPPPQPTMPRPEVRGGTATALRGEQPKPSSHHSGSSSSSSSPPSQPLTSEKFSSPQKNNPKERVHRKEDCHELPRASYQHAGFKIERECGDHRRRGGSSPGSSPALQNVGIHLRIDTGASRDLPGETTHRTLLRSPANSLNPAVGSPLS